MAILRWICLLYTSDAADDTPCVDVVAKRNGQFLVLRRAIPPLNNYWHLPGGRIQKGEVPEEAVYRKLKEETGLYPLDIKLIGVFNYFFKIRHDISITYLVEVGVGEIVLDYQHKEYRWVTGDTIPKPLHPVALNQITRAIKEVN